MTRQRPPKKSETLEIRLPLAAKAAFMARCQDRGCTASEAVRGFIERELEGARLVRRLRWRQVLAAALAGLAVGAVAAPSLAHPASSRSRAAFDRLDRNHDGVLSFDEFRQDQGR